MRLAAGALQAGGVTVKMRDAVTAHAGLVAVGVLGGENPIDTYRIDSRLATRTGLISRPALRQLVKLLFFWADEVTRLYLLEAEEKAFQNLLEVRREANRIQEEAGEAPLQMTRELEFQIRAVRMRMTLAPSRRAVVADEALPPYERTEGQGDR